MVEMKTPLFVDGNFNRTGKRTHAEFVKEVSNGSKTFRLWHTNEKMSYGRNELDVFYLFVEVEDYIVPLRGMTEWNLIDRVGYAAAKVALYGGDDHKRATMWREAKDTDALREKEDALVLQYGQDSTRQANYIEAILNEHAVNYTKARDNYTATLEKGRFFADFIGAAVLGEIDNCVALSARMRKDSEERERRFQELVKAEAERVRAERAEARKKELLETVEKFRSGGLIDDGRLVVEIADKYGVKIAVRTRGWILNTFSSCKISIANGNPEFEVRYWQKSGAKGSTKIYEVLGNIYTAISA